MNTIEAVPKSEVFLSKRRLGWAGLAALLGCSALCALPILAAAGGGAAAAIARLVRPGAELVVAGVVFAAALGFMAVRARSRMRVGSLGGCGESCAVPRASRLSGVDPVSVEAPKHSPNARVLFSRKGVDGAPIVCTADLTHAQVQIDGYRAAFARLLGAERFAGGFRWTFRAELGLASQLRGLAEREADCCTFFSYDLASDSQTIIWDIRGDGRVSSVMEEYFQLPDRLREEPRRGHDVAALKRAADKAGLGFTADIGAIGNTRG